MSGKVTQARQGEYLKCTKLKLPQNWFKTLFWKLQEQIMRKDNSCILNCKQPKRQGKILFLSTGNLWTEEIRVTACHRFLKKVFRHQVLWKAKKLCATNKGRHQSAKDKFEGSNPQKYVRRWKIQAVYEGLVVKWSNRGWTV